LERWVRLPWPQAASWYRPAQRLYDCSGLFPVRKDIFFRWAEVYRAALGALDLVAQWQPGGIFESVLEKKLLDRFCPRAFRAGFNLLRFTHPGAPWLDSLAALRWLVVHPFEKTIRTQLPHLAKLGVFSESAKPDLQQRESDTLIVACPQFAYMVPPRHRDWFQALEEMKGKMDRQRNEFDIALVGAGAWSLPLVAHAKQMGKKGIHLGGALQLLFGIQGGRFDPAGIYNQAWIRPLPEEIPANHRLMEEGAYW
jgi:hypothetical protein